MNPVNLNIVERRMGLLKLMQNSAQINRYLSRERQESDVDLR
jgi:hypothetical protein